jgi:3-methyladenine DNA glycosylase AlkD
LSYKSKTDLELLLEVILNLNKSNEFFIQKAIGWVLRQYARTDADWVRYFVEENQLKPLSKREALKHIS